MTEDEERFGRVLFGERWDAARKDEGAEWRRLYRAVDEVF